MQFEAYDLSTDRLTPHPFNLCSNAGSISHIIDNIYFPNTTSGYGTEHVHSTSLVDHVEDCSEWNLSCWTAVWSWPPCCCSVSGSWSSYYSLRHLYVEQRFSIPVLAPPLLCIFRVTLIASDVCSIRTQEVDITGYSAMIPVRSERIYSIQSAYKCARRGLKLYMFTEVYVSLVRGWRRGAEQIHEWMFRNEVNFSGFPLLRE